MLNRNDAIKKYGLEKVVQLESMDCIETDRVINDKKLMEFRASIQIDTNIFLHAYYYHDEQDVLDTDDLGDLTWTVSHYSITCVARKRAELNKS